MESGMQTVQPLRLLVTDSNHNVRDFLKRELEKEGYVVTSVNNGLALIDCLRKVGAYHVVVLDPEVFTPYGSSIYEAIMQLDPAVLILLHAYDEFTGNLVSAKNIHVIKKNASSISSLKKKIRECLRSGASC
jgi:CheY-like chemotaxis protein